MSKIVVAAAVSAVFGNPARWRAGSVSEFALAVQAKALKKVAGSVTFAIARFSSRAYSAGYVISQEP